MKGNTIRLLLHVIACGTIGYAQSYSNFSLISFLFGISLILLFDNILNYIITKKQKELNELKEKIEKKE